MLPDFNTIYQFYSDEVARNATITIETGTAVSPPEDTYGPSALVDDNPAKLAKIESTTGAWLLEYDAKQVVELASLIHTTCDESGLSGSPSVSVRIEGNNTDNWVTPAFSAEFVIPPWFGAGTRRWPQNPWLDLTVQDGYDDEGFFFYRIVVENNSQNIQVGQLWLGETIRRFDPDLKWALTDGAVKPQIENKTSFEVATTSSRGTTIWYREADLDATDELAADLERHWYDVDGAAHPWLLIPNGPIDDRRAYLVKYATTERQMRWNFEHYHQMRLAFREVGRGLRPGV